MLDTGPPITINSNKKAKKVANSQETLQPIVMFSRDVGAIEFLGQPKDTVDEMEE